MAGPGDLARWARRRAGQLAGGLGDALGAAGDVLDRLGTGALDITGDVAGGIGDELDRARAAARAVLSRMPRAVSGPALSGALLQSPTTAPFALAADPDVRRAVGEDVRAIRHGNVAQKAFGALNLVAEPVRQPVGRGITGLLGIDVAPGETPSAAIHRAVEEQSGLGRLLARAGEIAYLAATDPTQWLLAALTGGGSLAAAGAGGAARAGAGAGLGAVARREAMNLALVSALGAAGEEAGSAAAERLGLPREAGAVVGGLAAPIAGMLAVRRLERLERLEGPLARAITGGPGPGPGAGGQPAPSPLPAQAAAQAAGQVPSVPSDVLAQYARRLVRDPRVLPSARAAAADVTAGPLVPLAQVGIVHEAPDAVGLARARPTQAAKVATLPLRVVVYGTDADAAAAASILGARARPDLWQVVHVPADVAVTAERLLPIDVRLVRDALPDVIADLQRQGRLPAGAGLAPALAVQLGRDGEGRLRLAVADGAAAALVRSAGAQALTQARAAGMAGVPPAGVAETILSEALARAGVTFRRLGDPAAPVSPALLRDAVAATDAAHTDALQALLRGRAGQALPADVKDALDLAFGGPPSRPPLPPVTAGGGGGGLGGLAGDVARALWQSPAGRAAAGAGLGALGGVGYVHHEDTEDTEGQAGLADYLRAALVGGAVGAAAGLGVRPVARGAARLAAPALLRDRELNRVIAEYAQESSNVAQSARWLAQRELADAARALQEEIAAGRVQLTPAWAQQVERLKRVAVSPEAAARIEAAKLSVPVIRENPGGYVLSPRAQAALDVIDRAYQAEERRALALGLLTPEQLVEHYQNRLWQVAPSGGLGTPLRVGTLPAFARRRVFSSLLQGMAVGAEPATLDVTELYAARVADRIRAEAQVRLLERLADNPRWWTRAPGGAATPGTAGAVPLTEVALAEMAPDLPPAARRRLAERIAARVQSAAAGTVAGVPGVVGRPALTPEAAEAVRNQIAPGPSGGAWRAYQAVAGGVRFTALGTDVAMLLRAGPHAFFDQVAGQGPAAALGSFGRALKAAVRSEDFARMVRSADEYAADGTLVRPGWQTVARYAAQLAPEQMRLDLVRQIADQPWYERSRPLQSVVGRLERWQFGRLMPALTYETVADTYERLRRMPRFAHLSDEELLRQIAERTSAVTTGISRAQAGLSATHEEALRALLVSPAWTRGIVADLAGVASPGATGYIARRSWLAFLATGGALAVGLSWLLSGDASLDNLLRLADPRRPDAVTNPEGRYFFSVKLPNGDAVNLWGTRMPALRALARTAERLASRVGDAPPSLWFVPEVAGAVIDPDVTEPLRQFFERKQSIPIGTLRAVWLENRDFLGRPIATSDDPLVRLGQRVLYASASALPQSVSSLLLPTGDSSALPEYSPRTLQPARMLASAGAAFLGANYLIGPDDPGWVKDKIEAFLASQGESGGGDPVRALRTLPLSRTAVQGFLAQNPDVARYLEEERARRTGRNLPAGEDAARAYTTLAGQARVQRDAAIRAAGQALEQGQISGDQYRGRVRDAWDAYLGSLRAAAGLYFGTTDLDVAQQRVDRALGARAGLGGGGRSAGQGQTELDRLFERYEAIRIPENGTPEEVEAALAARHRFLQEHPELGPVLEDLARLRGGEVYARYARASRLAGELAQIPAYVGLSAEEGRRAGRAIARARDMVRYGFAPDVFTALVMTARTGELVPALLVLGGMARNPERRAFQMAHAADLAAFYSNMLLSEVDALTGAGGPRPS